ncbi:Dynein light chain 1, cytoplasmic [Schistosoma japonicum]|uniref:Dynein light chain n=1 Tax=Schistosoma japonicum TaxID=6182 RepID=A0A4Z2D637_SCHJA|nr:Dynein light chain 1, cytoplasmic [Schistosoma japonicum]
MQGTNCLLKNSDMSEEMKQKVIDLCTRGVEKFTLERDIACYIKKECDHHFKPTWHCIVGKNFGSLFIALIECLLRIDKRKNKMMAKKNLKK